MVVYRIENVHLAYPGGFCLVVPYLSLAEGKVLAVIGPNGAGKTTLLNTLAFFERPKGALIELFGKRLKKPQIDLNLRRLISVVFPRPYLLNDTVFNNIALPLRIRGIRNTAAVGQACEDFKIAHLKTKNALKISHGEMHRVALARALVTQPRLLLMDEPFSSLDPRYKDTLITDLRRTIRDNHLTTVFVTQDQSEALRLGDEICVMKNGRILQRDLPSRLFSHPASRDVADFVGIETIIEGQVVKKEDNLCSVKINGTTLEAISACERGDNVFVCIRPEDVIISRQDEATSARNRFKAKIIKIEPWMLEYKVAIEAGFPLVSFVTKQSIESLNLKPEKEIFVSFKATAIHLIKR
ncbi:MAG: ABC transporter ATP-binding protein [Candidatus Omnitrophica bacterium]|nr:ABC transporter ATP-binding protein [Candidatus Omnitrophota bacterium]